MSKLSSKEKVKHRKNSSAKINKGKTRNKQPSTIYIGTGNVKLWSDLKIACRFDCDVDFTDFLLKLAQKHIADQNAKDSAKNTNTKSSQKNVVQNVVKDEGESPTKASPETRKKKKSASKKKCSKGVSKQKTSINKKEKVKNKNNSATLKNELNDNVNIENVVSKIHADYPMPMVVVEKMDFSLSHINKPNNIFTSNESLVVEQKSNLDDLNLTQAEISDNVISESTKIDIIQNNVENLVLVHHIDEQVENIPVKENKKPKLEVEEYNNSIYRNKKDLPNKISKQKHEKNKRKIKNHDIRKAPELDVKTEILPEETQNDTKALFILQENLVKEDSEHVSIKIKLCNSCNTRHLQEACPLKKPLCILSDSMTLDEWIQNFEPKLEQSTSDDSDKNMEIDLQISMDSDDKSMDNFKREFNSYAVRSLPSILYLEETDSSHGLSVFTRCEIKEFCQFGPLVGKTIKEVDISEDFCMKYLWEIYAEKNIYVSTEDTVSSNWLRYVRPAPTRELRNLAVISQSEQLFMVTTRQIICGEELLYWQDDALGTNKKKMEKTNCGGCNLSFTHPLYYRMHCSVFHDIRYSLTIRKYHCKVCGLAVLGKDNIMKHAVELHNGQGAYQCQFCKKFFLRLNYLEMHRTYGCAANPHRSRPLCDFCGRKFCQPQKLKVHIKRMHSDMTEVLREFQCKSCMKLLGSRAALQRHVKEVHQKQVEGSCTCLRCGKLFQNKSNLKIHMLTHSGVKPFKCKEENCNAAFTTKQCLQFHYKKVHGFSEDMMPKIERSVEYTFAAYAGVKDVESDELFQETKTKSEDKMDDDNLMCLDESTDVDDLSLDGKNLDEPPALTSPTPLTSDHSSGPDPTPPILEGYNNTNRSGKVLSKGSKKWLGEQITNTLTLPLQPTQKDVYQFEKEIQKPDDPSNIILDVDETQNFDKNRLNINLNMYNRHESSNASLLVEAALDSVSDIQITSTEANIDVSGSQSCTDSLVNNLYSLSHQDNLPDVSYNNNEDLNESRDINLISPSVNDHISVTDHDLNDDLPNRGISLDYSTLQQNEFSPSSSPNLQTRTQLINEYNLHGNSPSNTPRRLEYNLGPESPGNSSPRYDFNQSTVNDNLSSDESNDIVAQNLSLSNTKEKIRLDLVGYKSHYGDIDTSELRKYESFRLKYDLENERNKIYEIALDDRTKSYNESGLNSDIRNKFDITNSTECSSKGYTENIDSERMKQYDNLEHSDLKIKQFDIDSDFRTNLMVRNKYDQLNSKYDEDLHNKQIGIDDLRSKNFDTLDTDRNKSIYDTSLDADIRNKTYDVVESLEGRNKNYDNIVDSDFRTDRNFEPLVLNSTELQGLDMSARSYHNFHPTSSIQSINRYHHIYSELERPSVDLRLGYSPPPPPYSHADVLRVVSLDLTPPGRHSVDLSLRSHTLHPHQLPNSRLLGDLQTNRLISSEHNLTTNRILSEHNRLTLDQSRLLSAEHNLTTNRLLGSDRLMSESNNRLISDHTTNRILSNDQLSTNRLLSTEQSRVMSDENRLLSEQSRLLDQRGLLGDTRILQPTPTNTPSLDLVARGSLSPNYAGYSVSPSPYHASSLAARSHGSSPGHTAAGYHHYSSYY